eukprot:1216641-Amphidinium_carterae.2
MLLPSKDPLYLSGGIAVPTLAAGQSLSRLAGYACMAGKALIWRLVIDQLQHSGLSWPLSC